MQFVTIFLNRKLFASPSSLQNIATDNPIEKTKSEKA